MIVAQVLTDGHADDAARMEELLDAGEGDITSIVADAAHDTLAVYEAASARRAEVIVPPTRTAVVSRRRQRSAARDRTIKRAEEVGRRQWKTESGYHQQGAVENAFFRYKTIIGGSLRALRSDAQAAEATLACDVMTRMSEPGDPASGAIAR